MAPRVPTRKSGAPDRAPVDEQICPSCGQPMLRSWGATCGACRPPMNQARAAESIETARRGQRALALAWLAVIDTPDPDRQGQVLALEEPIAILTREGAVAGVPGEIPLRDDFMSAGHAVLRRTDAGAEPTFTLEDRREPGPSANGTFLNQRRLDGGEAATLGDGDEIRVGSTELVFRTLLIPGGRR